jgi:hypothetical protein
MTPWLFPLALVTVAVAIEALSLHRLAVSDGVRSLRKWAWAARCVRCNPRGGTVCVAIGRASSHGPHGLRAPRRHGVHDGGCATPEGAPA